MQDATRVIRAGLKPAEQGESFSTGPVFAAAFHAAGDPASAPYTYGRFHNPTWSAYEQALGDLEGGDALVFSSGMAASTAVLGAMLAPKDIVVVPSDSYYTTRLVIDGYFAAMGVDVRRAPTIGDAQLDHVAGARLVWIETPTNPTMKVVDIKTCADLVHEHNKDIVVVVDNTFMSAYFQVRVTDV